MNGTEQRSLFVREQFRMSKLQVYNWGTFENLHTIPIAERGFLFTGPSGSGKTTLLDAFSALLVPPKWIDFNAAAREHTRSGRDRNWASYVRGAWAEQKDEDSGEFAVQYLRKRTTWSALALTFRNALDQTVVLVQLFWIRGTANANADVRKCFMIFERAFDLSEIADFDLDIRKLKQSLPGAFIRDEFSAYSERYRRLLGIENEMALRLLHKTQSAKNLGDLNSFMREFMLDEPDTFKAADRLVGEFLELNAAHQAVVTARDQVKTLAPAREEHAQVKSVKLERTRLERLRESIDLYRESRRETLLQERIAELDIEAERWNGETRRLEGLLGNQKALIRDLEQEQRDAGGDRIEQWEAEKRNVEEQRAARLNRFEQARNACWKLAWPMPDTPQAFAEAAGRARQELEDFQQRVDVLRDGQFEADRRKKDADKAFRVVLAEVESLTRQPSNIPAHMLGLRRDIAVALGVSEDALPFAGELIQVRPQESPWQGAVERVLHNLALSLLVEERHYAPLSAYVNSAQLNARLVYYKTGRPEPRERRTLAPDSLIRKLELKDGIHRAWLEAELERRFDFACVDSIQAFRQKEHALTREGQVRQRDRHEKDDRKSVDDRRNWVLGFDNREKLALFQRETQELAAEISALDSSLRSMRDEERVCNDRRMHCQTLANTTWPEIDVAPLLDRYAELERHLQQAREGNSTLKDTSRRLEAAKQQADTLEKDLRKSAGKSEKVEESLEDSRKKLRELGALASLEAPLREALDARFADLRQSVTLDNLDAQARHVERSLTDEMKTLYDEHNRLEKAIENRFAEFKRKWPMEAGDMDATLASAPEFIAKLHRLETDGLPAHEHRFFDLLRNQSHQNLAALSTSLTQARKDILERMELVNESLGNVNFNPGTFLHIDVTDRQLEEVREFRQEIHQALSYGLADEREAAEARFVVLRRMVERIGSQELEQKNWRARVLDVRQHVEFVGRERDSDGLEIEVYRSGAGKSGGQRQKLATTCLAAALRYQLGGIDQGAPIYAPVVLDEAFDKADNEFTELAMKVFEHFGFQMIVATPLKSVMTLEPFIGGACFVHIRDRCRSGVLMIEYDAKRQRLDLPEQIHGESIIHMP